MRLATISMILFALPAAATAEETHLCFLINPNESPDAALTACTKFINDGIGDDETRGDAFTNRGVAQRELGNLTESVKDLSLAVELTDDTGIRRMLAWTYREMDRPAEAEALYTRVLETDDHWQGWLSRCVVRQDQEKYSEAAEDCEQAILRDPDNTDALYFAARAYNFLGDGTSAMPHAENALNLEPDESRHVVEMVWATYFSGNLQAAKNLAREGQENFPHEEEFAIFLKQLE